MKNYNTLKILILVFFVGIFTNTNSQNIHAETRDGQKVTLRSDHTWKYTNLSKPGNGNPSECDHSANFKEPEGDTELNAWLEKMQMTISELKKNAAKDYGCLPKEVLVTQISESHIQGKYELCIKGEHVEYYRTNMFFHKYLHEPIIFH